jgi:protein-disulfide isomerase
MAQSTRSHIVQGARRLGAPRITHLALLAGLLFLGCQTKKEVEAPAPTPSASGAVAAATGPCSDMVAKLCERAGEKSELCNASKSLGDVLPPDACLAAVKDFAQVGQRIDAERQVCSALVERLCADIGPATDTCKMVREQTPEFPKERCEELTREYDQVLGELKQREAQNQPLPPDVQAKLAAKDAPSFGPENAKVTLVEFSDFQCPYCSRAAEVVHKVRERYGDKVRFVFRQFPLDFHKQAHLAAQAALAAHQQGKFWEFHDLLFANQNALGREQLEQYAKQLDVKNIDQALDSAKYKAAVDADVSLGGTVAVNGTPTLFINGKRIANPTDFDVVSKAIEDALGA